MRRLILQTLMSGGVKVAGAALTFLMFMFLARVMTVDEYGRFALMFSLGSLGALLALFGQNTRVLKRLSASLEAQDIEKARNVFWQSWVMAGIGGVLVVVALLAAATSLEVLDTGYDIWILVGAAFFILPFAFSELVSSHLRVFDSLLWALVPRDIVWRVIVIFCAMSIGMGLFDFQGALEVMTIVSGVLSLCVIASFWRASRIMPSELRPFATLTNQASQIWHESSWLWAASLVAGLSMHLSVLILGLLMTSADAGAYFAALKISQLLHLPMMAVSVIAVPNVARLIANGDKAELQNYCRVMAIILAVSSAICGAAIFCAPHWFLSLLGEDFEIASNALVLLASGFLVTAFCGLSNTLMIAGNGERRFVMYQFMFDGGAIVLIFPMVYFWSLEGAAFATLLGKVGWNIAAVAWCRSELRVDPTVLAGVQASKSLTNDKTIEERPN